MVTEPVFNLVRLARFQTMLPAVHGAFLILGMKYAFPALTIGRAIGNAGEFIPTRIVIIMMAVGQCGPDHLGHGIGQHLQLGLAHFKRSLCIQLAFHFDVGAEPTDHLALIISDGHDTGKKAPEHAIRAPDGEKHFKRVAG